MHLTHPHQGGVRRLGLLFPHLYSAQISSHFVPSDPTPSAARVSRLRLQRAPVHVGTHRAGGSREGAVPKMPLSTATPTQLCPALPPHPRRGLFFPSWRLLLYARGSHQQKVRAAIPFPLPLCWRKGTPGNEWHRSPAAPAASGARRGLWPGGLRGLCSLLAPRLTPEHWEKSKYLLICGRSTQTSVTKGTLGTQPTPSSARNICSPPWACRSSPSAQAGFHPPHQKPRWVVGDPSVPLDALS